MELLVREYDENDELVSVLANLKGLDDVEVGEDSVRWYDEDGLQCICFRSSSEVTRTPRGYIVDITRCCF